MCRVVLWARRGGWRWTESSVDECLAVGRLYGIWSPTGFCSLVV